MKPSASRWSYTVSASKVASALSYRLCGAWRPTTCTVPLYNLRRTCPVTCLAPVDQGLQHLALGAEPEAVVDQLGVARHELVLEVRRAAIERDRSDRAVRRQQHCAWPVHPARLHADEAVLDQIDAADAVGAGQLVQAREQDGRGQRFAVDRDRIATLEGELDVGRLVRRILGRHGPAVHARVRLLPGILERAAS